MVVLVFLVVAGRLDIGYCGNKMYLVLNWVTVDNSGSLVLSVAVERFDTGIVDLWRGLLHSVWVHMNCKEIETKRELSDQKHKSFRLRPAQFEPP